MPVFGSGERDVVLVGVAGRIPHPGLNAFKSNAALLLVRELDP